ncbi:hypothetical protein TELCIR_17362, partial [Teladorsagia circumcincta]
MIRVAGKMTRISDDVCPLKVVLSWGNAKCGRALVLQENDTGDILEKDEKSKENSTLGERRKIEGEFHGRKLKR